MTQGTLDIEILRCPKCYAADALQRARAMVEAGAHDKVNRAYPRAFGLFEAVLERIRDEPCLQLCGKHASETAHAEFGVLFGSVAAAVPDVGAFARSFDVQKLLQRMREVDDECRAIEGYIDCSKCKRPWFVPGAETYVCRFCKEQDDDEDETTDRGES